MNKDGVATAFELIVEEIEAVAKDLAEQGAKAFRDKAYPVAKQLSESGQSLEEFRAKVDKLLDEWQSGIDVATRQRFTTARHQSLFPTEPTRPRPQRIQQERAARTGIRAIFPDGETIEEYVAADTFALAIRKLGLARVEALGLNERHTPLVSDTRSPTYIQRRVDSKYVLVHSTTQEKKEMLDRVAKRLGVALKVQIT